MTPILFEKNETNFSTFGLGALSDVTSCICTEERNGLYECIFTYPITGKYYEEIQAERIIKAKAKPLGDDQLFRIYRMSKPIHGIVTVYAQHISYDLSGVPVTPFSAALTPTTAMTRLFTGTDFVGHSDISGTKTFGPATPRSARAMLGGTEGSILDLWGGEYKWDNFDVYLNTHRGLDKQVVIEYGKNLTDLVADHDLSEVYSELLPYAIYNDESGSHTVTGSTIPITSVITRQKTLIKDFTTSFDDEMTPAQVTAAAQAWLNDNPLGYETPSLSVSFIDLPHDVNYPAAAATIDLCDTVTIRYTALGVDVKAKVIACEYDSLLERYTTLTIGKARASMTDTVASLTEVAQKTSEYPAMWKTAIEVATEMITGNAGGYVVLHEGPDGKPYELLVMDNEDISMAQKIWRWTQGGLGYSTNGYAGPYELAITADGKINADFIRAGRLLVSDAQNNALFDANIATNSVQIGGFVVGPDTLTSEASSVGDRLTLGAGYLMFENDNPQLGDNLYLNGDTIRMIDTYTGGGEFKVNLITYQGLKMEWPSAFATGPLTLNPRKLEMSATDGTAALLEPNRLTLTATDGYKTLVTGKAIYFDDANGNRLTDIRPSGPGAGHREGTTSVSSGSGYTTIAQIDLDAGTSVIFASAVFPANATGRRTLVLSTSQNSGTPYKDCLLDNRNAVANGSTNCSVAFAVFVNQATTLYVNAYQNSGAAMNVNWMHQHVRIV